ncbi:hypothetical protein Q7P35_003005 [Cladosporium inversicolor]
MPALEKSAKRSPPPPRGVAPSVQTFCGSSRSREQSNTNSNGDTFHGSSRSVEQSNITSSSIKGDEPFHESSRFVEQSNSTTRRGSTAGNVPRTLVENTFGEQGPIVLDDADGNSPGYAAAAAGPSTNAWPCRKCTFLNEATSLVCAVCDTWNLDEDEDEDAPSLRPSDNEEWACYQCTFINTATVLACTMCSAVKQQGSTWRGNLPNAAGDRSQRALNFSAYGSYLSQTDKANRFEPETSEEDSDDDIPLAPRRRSTGQRAVVDSEASDADAVKQRPSQSSHNDVDDPNHSSESLPVAPRRRSTRKPTFTVSDASAEDNDASLPDVDSLVPRRRSTRKRNATTFEAAEEELANERTGRSSDDEFDEVDSEHDSDDEEEDDCSDVDDLEEIREQLEADEILEAFGEAGLAALKVSQEVERDFLENDEDEGYAEPEPKPSGKRKRTVGKQPARKRQAKYSVGNNFLDPDNYQHLDLGPENVPKWFSKLSAEAVAEKHAKAREYLVEYYASLKLEAKDLRLPLPRTSRFSRATLRIFQSPRWTPERLADLFLEEQSLYVRYLYALPRPPTTAEHNAIPAPTRDQLKGSIVYSKLIATPDKEYRYGGSGTSRFGGGMRLWAYNKMLRTYHTADDQPVNLAESQYGVMMRPDTKVHARVIGSWPRARISTVLANFMESTQVDMNGYMNDAVPPKEKITWYSLQSEEIRDLSRNSFPSGKAKGNFKGLNRCYPSKQGARGGYLQSIGDELNWNCSMCKAGLNPNHKDPKHANHWKLGFALIPPIPLEETKLLCRSCSIAWEEMP